MSRIHELYNNVTVKPGVSPIAVGTTGTGQAGKIIDRQGYDGVLFLVEYGTMTATGAVFTLVMKEGDVTGTMTSVADADMLPNKTGPEALAGVAAATPRTSGTDKNSIKKLGYKGIKRYVQLGVKSTLTAAPPVAISAILFNPEVSPTP